jgi:predicted PurR-regulated permease PerM
MKQGTRTEVDATTSRAQSEGNGFSWKSLTLFLLTICMVLICLRILRPFLHAVTGAIVLAIVTQHPHMWITSRLRYKSLGASISVTLVSLSIIGPALFLAQSLGYRILSVARAVQSGAAERRIQQFLDHSPRLSTVFQYSVDNITLSQAFDKSAGFMAARLGAVLGGSISAITQIVVMLFLLFFLYRDGNLGIAYLRSIVPLNERETDHLFSRLVDTVRATVMGHLLVAAIQGLAAGITLASLGISSASLLGVATFFFAMVPPFGAFVVWVPIAIYLAVTHHWIQTGILMAVGTLVISTLDNILYPVLVGNQLRLHTAPIFISIVGGIWLFGISGLILGPIVFALTQSLLDIWRERLTSPFHRAAQSN